MPLPQTEMPGRLQAFCAERGIRMTQQRRAILSVMETTKKHLDAAQPAQSAAPGCFGGPQHGLPHAAIAQTAGIN